MPPHGVEGVAGTVPQKSGDPGASAPEQRSDDGIGGVLGDRLHRCTSELGGVEVVGVTAHEITDAHAGTGQVIVGEEVGDRIPLGHEAPASQNDPGGQSRGCDAGHRASPGGGVQRGADQSTGPDERERSHGTARAVIAMEAVLDHGRDGAEPRDRMVSPGITQEQIGCVAQGETACAGCCVVHATAHSVITRPATTRCTSSEAAATV